jgi:hypothetical protein
VLALALKDNLVVVSPIGSNPKKELAGYIAPSPVAAVELKSASVKYK